LYPQLQFDSSHSLPRNGPHSAAVSIAPYFTHKH